MVEPFSRYITYKCKCKRYHKKIFEMWEKGYSNVEILAELNRIGLKVDRKTLGNYINRCLEEINLPHDYSLPRPKNYNGKYRKYHNQIAHLRNYLGYSCKEIANELNLPVRYLTVYLQKCVKLKNI